MNRAKIFGITTSLMTVFFYVMFDTAAVLGLTGILASPFWISISWYGPSLLLAYSFMGMMISFYKDPAVNRDVFSMYSLILAVIYVTLNSFVYTIQVLVVAPSFLNGTFQDIAMFEMAENKPFYSVNGLAYTLMGLSTLFMSFSIHGKGKVNAVRLLMLIHGIAAPFVFGALLFKPFFLISSTVGVTCPLLGIASALYFGQSVKEM